MKIFLFDTIMFFYLTKTFLVLLLFVGDKERDVMKSLRGWGLEGFLENRKTTFFGVER